MRQAATIDRAGRVVLSVEVRRRLNLSPGARLVLDVVSQPLRAAIGRCD
jgi:bifunctional DNA-binding transcriptional regulator/antitoxin component of YhaV-PrlF toxin-antitoxin module